MTALTFIENMYTYYLESKVSFLHIFTHLVRQIKARYNFSNYNLTNMCRHDFSPFTYGITGLIKIKTLYVGINCVSFKM